MEPYLTIVVFVLLLALMLGVPLVRAKTALAEARAAELGEDDRGTQVPGLRVRVENTETGDVFYGTVYTRNV